MRYDVIVTILEGNYCDYKHFDDAIDCCFLNEGKLLKIILEEGFEIFNMDKILEVSAKPSKECVGED